METDLGIFIVSYCVTVTFSNFHYYYLKAFFQYNKVLILAFLEYIPEQCLSEPDESGFCLELGKIFS